MIAGLDDLLESTGAIGLHELRAAVVELLGGHRAEGRVLHEQRLDSKGYVNRVRFEVNGAPISVVAKCSRPVTALRNRLIVRRYLPAVGLDEAAPAILAIAAERGGRGVWHVYEDLGERTLETDRDPETVQAGVHLLAELHTRFIGHPMIAEARNWGSDLGAGFYGASVRDAITALEAISPSDLDERGDRVALRDRLLERMWALRAEERERTEAITDLGGPETLLHGDTWLKNAAVVEGGTHMPVRLIDWDRAGFGPPTYDLSTFVNGFDPDERDRVVELYQEAVAVSDWPLPSREDMNYLFATFELARIANCVIWPALGARERIEGALEELELTDAWLESMDSIVQTP